MKNDFLIFHSSDFSFREQLAQKEEALANDQRSHQQQASELQNKIQELLMGQSKFDQQVAERAAKYVENPQLKNSFLLALRTLYSPFFF